MSRPRRRSAACAARTSAASRPSRAFRTARARRARTASCRPSIRRSGAACATRSSTGRARRSASPARRRPAGTGGRRRRPAPGKRRLLVLNVWTPALGDGRKRPVMIWCHGGGFATGSGSSPGTDGTNLARRGDVVVVSINHRLNVLGFTYLGEIGGAEFAQIGRRRHARHRARAQMGARQHRPFGGDPGNVTVFGQSGGGRKVATLLAMPSAKGLFHRAIIESGATIQLVERDRPRASRASSSPKLGFQPTPAARAAGLPVDRIMARVLRHRAQHERGTDDDGLLADRRRQRRPAASVPPDGVRVSRTCRSSSAPRARSSRRARTRRCSRSTRPACATRIDALLGEASRR